MADDLFAPASSEPDLNQVVLSENILNYFRSYNYLFTLSVLPSSIFGLVGTPDFERKLQEYKSKFD